MKALDLQGPKQVLMALMASRDITVEEYAEFIRAYSKKDLERVLNSGDSEPDYDYEPMIDADEKTLKLKIQMHGVTKPPIMVDDHMMDIQFVNEELADIPDQWENIV